MLAARCCGARWTLGVTARRSSTQPPAGQQPAAASSSGEAKKEVEYYKPAYATKATFDRTKDEHRFKSAGAESGHQPSKWQRRFLVWTKIYQNAAAIPEFVSNQTMNRMHDRMRVLFILVGCTGFFVFFYIIERYNAARIARDLRAGKVVTKM